MFSQSKNMENMGKLFLEFKRYLELQKEFVKLDAAEKTTIVFSAAVTIAVVLLLGSIALLFFAFATAYYLGNVLESLSLGFCIVAAAVVVVALIFYSNRNRMVIQPIARFMANLILTKKEEDGNK